MKIFINNTISIIIFVFIVSSISASPIYSQITDLNFETIDGKLVQLSDYTARGPVYMSFWALWCRSCKSELKILEAIHNKLKEQGFTVIAINIDTPKSSAKVKSYISSQNFSFPNMIDPNSKIFEMFNGKDLPFSLLIDSDGKIIKTRRGFLPGDEKYIEEDIVNLINPK